MVEDDTLDAPFTESEIEGIVKLIPAEKAPGPDGFTGSFYKRCWHTIKADIMEAMSCFYQLRAGPFEHLNGANIVLIPKARGSRICKGF